MKKVTLLLSLFILCMSSDISTQSLPSKTENTFDNNRCTTMEALEYRMANDSKYADFRNAALAIPSITNQARIPCDASNTIRVPVAFHFDEGFACGNVDCVLPEVIEQLDALNLGFADNSGTPQQAICPQAYLDENGNDAASTGTCIEFYMPTPPAATGLDICDLPITLGQFNGGLNGGGSGAGAAWAGILNIFITNNQCAGVADGIPGAANGDGVTVCQAVFGGVGGPSPACNLDTDGSYDLGITLTHEVGHYLGLYHTFQGGCGTQETNPPGPFDVLDTPAHSTPTSGNPTGCINSSCGGVRPTANFMDYTDDAGYSMFTEDQAQVMNYWANQLFASNTLPDADPAGTITTACGGVCTVICPTQVIAPYSDALDLCASLGTYDLPTDFSSVTLDESISTTFTWSTGNYINSGGTGISGTFALTNPSTCAPVTETLYLNAGCSDGSITPLGAGTLVLTIYPDPTQFAPADLVTFMDGVCDEPTWTSDCAAYVTVTQNGGPAFPVTSGAGPVDYDVTLNYPVECCCPVTAGSETQSNTNAINIPDNGGAGNPGCTIVTINTGDPITSVIVDVDITHTYVGDLTITLTSPSGTVITLGNEPSGGSCGGNDLTVTFDDAATNTAADYIGTCGNAPAISGAYQPADPLSTFAGESAAGVWTLCVVDDAGVDVGTIDNFGLTVNTEVPCTDPVDCAFMGTANYDCSVACANVDLSIQFDGFPSQSSWEIIEDATGMVVTSGDGSGAVANGSTTEMTCLFDGCYTLNFYDSVGNGLCPFQSTATSSGTFITPGTLITAGSVVATLGTVVSPGICGNFTLTDINGTTLASAVGAFGALSSQQFCLNGGVGPLWHEEDNSAYLRQDESVRLEVFPTLAKNNLSVYTSHTTEGQINVVDMNGQIIQQHQQRTQNMQLDVSGLPSGIYFIHVIANNSALVQKFIKY